jgi:hypothetical protein
MNETQMHLLIRAFREAKHAIVPQPAFCYFTEILDAKTETRRRAVEREAVALGYGEQLKKYRNAECPLRYKCRCGDSQHAEIGKLPDYLIKQFREAAQESE